MKQTTSKPYPNRFKIVKNSFKVRLRMKMRWKTQKSKQMQTMTSQGSMLEGVGNHEQTKRSNLRTIERTNDPTNERASHRGDFNRTSRWSYQLCRLNLSLNFGWKASRSILAWRYKEHLFVAISACVPFKRGTNPNRTPRYKEHFLVAVSACVSSVEQILTENLLQGRLWG